MVDISIQIERFRQKDGSYSPPLHRTGKGNTEQRYSVFYNGEEIGVWRYPEFSAARELIELRAAERHDVLHTFRGSILSMQGDIGWFADHTIVENARDGGPRTVKWRPMPEFD